MASHGWVAIWALCFATLVESKDSFVRRATVDAAGQIRHEDYAMDMHITMGVDAQGRVSDIGFDHGDDQHTGKTSEEALDEDVEHRRVTKDNYTATLVRAQAMAHEQPDEHAQVGANGSRRQIPENIPSCDRLPEKKNRFKECYVMECGSPPEAYMVGIKDSHTYMESFGSEDDVDMYSYWPGEVTRTQVDKHMVPVKDHCVCDGCQGWSDWALTVLATPDKCKFPEFEWRLVWSKPTPTVSKQEPAKFEVGRMLEVRNSLLRNMAWGDELTINAFTIKPNFAHVATQEPEDVWKDYHIVDRVLDIVSGETKAVYQFVFKCKVFNALGMYINVAEFRTPNFVEKDELSPPNCNPNQDGGFYECHRMASQAHTNAETGSSEMVDPLGTDQSNPTE